MKKQNRWQALVCAVGFATASTALAAPYYHPNVFQDTNQLMTLADNLHNVSYAAPATMGSDPALESFLLWGSTQSFSLVLQRTVNIDTTAVMRTLFYVENQLNRTSSVFRMRHDTSSQQIMLLDQIARQIAMIRADLTLRPASAGSPPVVNGPTVVAQCKTKGNMFTPDLVIQGSITGVAVRKATVYWKGVPVGDLSGVDIYYTKNPNDRRRRAIIPYFQIFQKVSPGPGVCQVVAEDEFGNTGSTEVTGG